ncbi:hypothetical protein BGW39_001560, partial [Mortierella sp. 14UC]
MHSSTALSSSSTPNSYNQRLNNNNNRKGGLTSPLQNQNQNLFQSRQNNYNSTNSRYTQRTSGQQANPCHQRMPPQLRGYNSKLKFDTTTVFPVAEAADSGLMMRHLPQQQQQQRNQFSQSNSKPRPQSKPQPSKARRVQRRREIDTVTDSLAYIDLDLDLNQSPPLNPSSPPSSSDSDDSESTLSRSIHFLGSKASRHIINSPPQRPSSAPTPQTQPAQRTRTSTHLTYTSVDMMHRPNSADSVMFPERAPTGKKNGLYAGPTFHNSPAPTSLPIPSFGRPLGNGPLEPLIEKLPSGTFFGEATSPQLNSMRLQHSHHSSPHWTGSVSHGSDQLMEISHNLRMLLKIQS